MELVLDLKKRYSYADYLTWMDDKRRELIDGFIKMMSPAASLPHARLVGRIYNPIFYHIKRNHGLCEVFTAPFDVRLPKNGETENQQIYTVVQPDIVVVCDPAKLDKRGCLGAPDLIVEILSPATRKYDLNEKFNLYERSGVKEYWVVSPNDEDVTVFLLQADGKYNRGTVYDEDNTTIPAGALPGLEIDIKELFEKI
jgi:Uma2 family endonuclease